MARLVKQFIEDNIETINRSDWRQLFLDWYHGYASEDSECDAEYLKELFRALQTAGINCKENSKEARMQILHEMIQDYVIAEKVAQKDVVTVTGAVNSLNSWLGAYSIARKITLVRNVFEQMNLEPDSDLKLRYKLK